MGSDSKSGQRREEFGPDFLIDCSLTLDAFGPTGFGDCTNGRGDKFRLMFLAFTGE